LRSIAFLRDSTLRKTFGHTDTTTEDTEITIGKNNKTVFQYKIQREKTASAKITAAVFFLKNFFGYFFKKVLTNSISYDIIIAKLDLLG